MLLNMVIIQGTQNSENILIAKKKNAVETSLHFKEKKPH